MSRPTKQQTKEIILAIHRIMGEDKNPKKILWKLLKEIVRPKHDKPGRLKDVNWLLDQILKFQKKGFKK